jgi:hypothetical protein
MNNNLSIICGNGSCTSGESQITPAVLRLKIHKITASFKICLDSRIGWATVPGAPKHLTTAPMVHLFQSSEILVTPKPDRNALVGSETLLKLMLLSLHSTSSQTLLEAPSD